MIEIRDLTGPMRIPFLILTPACVLLGLGTAIWTSGRINFLDFILVLLGATSAHISVNVFNEYFDFKSSLDFKTRKTPFSGGSGTFPANPSAVRYALATAIITLAITVLIGIYLCIMVGVRLLPIGVLGIASSLPIQPGLRDIQSYA